MAGGEQHAAADSRRCKPAVPFASLPPGGFRPQHCQLGSIPSTAGAVHAVADRAGARWTISPLMPTVRTVSRRRCRSRPGSSTADASRRAWLLRYTPAWCGVRAAHLPHGRAADGALSRDSQADVTSRRAGAIEQTRASASRDTVACAVSRKRHGTAVDPQRASLDGHYCHRVRGGAGAQQDTARRTKPPSP